MKHKIKIFLKFFAVFLIFFFIIVSTWVLDNFGEISVAQVLYHLYAPIGGTNKELIYDFIFKCIIIPFIISLILIILYHKFVSTRYLQEKIVMYFSRGSICVLILALVISTVYCLKTLSIDAYIHDMTNLSTIYEDYYVDPKEEKYIFPETKRNLIYIFLESMETSFYSKELGGVKDVNLIPELYQMSRDNISFVDSNNGGFYIAPGTSWTVAAMVGQTAGVPINVSLEGSSYGEKGNFLPGCYSLGDILNKEGYHQELLIGSEASFGARDNYFSQHGDYNIEDYISAQENGYIPEDYWYWWGFEDQRLYEIAKTKLDILSQSDEPFNLTLLTVDTHTPTGCDCPKCRHKYDDQYSNVIDCASGQVYEFVEWIKEQPFYANTTIVICGDHTTMNDNYVDAPSDYVRKGYNTFINSAINTENKNNRELSTFDMFPTTLASLGINWDSDRLGLGTNLFSNEKTLLELLGYEVFSEQVSMNSDYYNRYILHKY